VLVAGLFAGIETLIVFVLEPLFYGRSAGVSAIALLIATAFWAWLWGPIGLALAVPLTVCLVVFSRAIKGLEFIEILVSDDSGVEPNITYYQRVLAGDEQEAVELIREAAKTGSLEAAYDAILVPALARARHDREAAQLTPVEYAHVIESTRQVLERATEAAQERAPLVISPGPATAPITIAGCPVDDEADRVVLEMLARLLGLAAYRVHVTQAGGLVAEMAAAIQALRPSLICLGALEGIGRARHLVKRLRVAFPDFPILVGCWGLHGAEPRRELRAAGADDVVSSLAEARTSALRLTRSSARQSPRASRTTPSGPDWVHLEPAVKEIP